MQIKANGRARIERKKYMRGDATVTDEVPARITKHRVAVAGHVFDRATGKRVSQFNPYIKGRRLVAYKLATGDWEFIPDVVQRAQNIAGLLRMNPDEANLETAEVIEDLIEVIET